MSDLPLMKLSALSWNCPFVSFATWVMLVRLQRIMPMLAALTQIVTVRLMLLLKTISFPLSMM